MNPLTIKGAGLEASLTPFGAAIIDLRFCGTQDRAISKSLILSHEDITNYETNDEHLGSIVGRFANRIRGAKFNLNEKQYQLEANWLGKHTLHGGRKGISKQKWEVLEHISNSITFSTLDDESLSGFPGICKIDVTYSLNCNQTLDILIKATADEVTPCSITAHPYFNLGNSCTIDNHMFEIVADSYLPTDVECLPTGDTLNVRDTDFDFKQIKSLGQLRDIDHNFCIANRRTEMQLMARAKAMDTGISMEVWSNETGLQFYTGGGLNGHFTAYQGFCFEPQAWPDAPNQNHFPSSLISPENPYQHAIKYVFSEN